MSKYKDNNKLAYKAITSPLFDVIGCIKPWFGRSLKEF